MGSIYSPNGEYDSTVEKTPLGIYIPLWGAPIVDLISGHKSPLVPPNMNWGTNTTISGNTRTLWGYPPNGGAPMCRLPPFGRRNPACGDDPHMSVPTYGAFPFWDASHVWEVFPHLGRPPIYGKTAHLWHGTSSHMWEDFPSMGRLPIDEKSSQIWEDFLYI